MVSSTLHNTELHACMLSCFSHVQLFVTLWTVAHQAPLSLEFSRQEHWSGFPCPPPGIFATPWTVAHQAPLSLVFSRQEYWSGLPCLPPGDLSDPGTEPMSLMSPAMAGGFFTTSTTWEALIKSKQNKKKQFSFYLF